MAPVPVSIGRSVRSAFMVWLCLGRRWIHCQRLDRHLPRTLFGGGLAANFATCWASAWQTRCFRVDVINKRHSGNHPHLAGGMPCGFLPVDFTHVLDIGMLDFEVLFLGRVLDHGFLDNRAGLPSVVRE